MKTVTILGSTGSIGINALSVAEQFPEELCVVGLSTNRNVDLLRQQVRKFSPRSVAVLDETLGRAFESEMRGVTRVFVGADGFEEFAAFDHPAIVLNALVGFAGLRPTIRAIKSGCAIALANKETLVVAGALITALLSEHNVPLYPVDSEHSAIWQCLVGERPESVKRLILTASGGPFRTLPPNELTGVTVEQALNHPKWRMGKKISIDSATLMNKGLEVHEARWLFHVPGERIDVVVHPQSIVHSFVEFTDGSVKAQLGVTDMKLPIVYALLFPKRAPVQHTTLDITSMGALTFEAPDRKTFPCLQVAYDALQAAGVAPAVMNAANEIAVDAFLNKRIGFTDIPRVVSHALDRVPNHDATLENIIAADTDGRCAAEEFVLNQCQSS